MEASRTVNPMISPPVEPDESVAPQPVAAVQESQTMQAVEEAQQRLSHDQAPEPPQQQAQQQPQQQAEPEPEDIVDVLVPKAKSVRWTFGPDGQFNFTQRPLSFIAKMQWFSLVGEVLDKALSGDNAMSLNSLFSAPGRPGELTMADFRDADTFVQAIGKLLGVAPDFLVKSHCIWLNVPDWQRDLVASVMALPEDEGGLSDDQGIEIIETFIDQNYEALDRFFRDLLARLAKRVQQRAADATSSRQSRR
jgi:hypothetical protein